MNNDPSAKIWLVLDWPIEHFEADTLLNNVLSNHGINRSECFTTYISHKAPPNNDFTKLNPADLEADLVSLYECLNIEKDKIILALGSYALKYLTGKNGIGNFRGSVLKFKDPLINDTSLIIPTYNPTNVLREYTHYPIFDFDISKAKRISKEGYENPAFNFRYRDSVTWEDIARYANAKTLASDIESIKGTTIIRCVGFAISRTEAISLDFRSQRGMIEALLNSEAEKVFHNGNFDVTMLELNGINVRNYAHDTIIQAHVLNPEFPRKLSFLTSLYTNINYYKSEGKDEDDEKAWSESRTLPELMEYNCKDCIATIWIHEIQYPSILSNEHHTRIYSHEMKLALVTIKMGHNGLLLDVERNNLLRSILDKKDKKHEFILNTLIGTDINIRSPKQVMFLLYEHYALPKRSKYDKKKRESKKTSDNDALVSLISYIKTQQDKLKKDGTVWTKWKVKLLVLQSIIAMRGIKKLISSYIDIETHNGKIKSTYKVAGTESGRLATGNFVNGSGINLATLPREAIEE